MKALRSSCPPCVVLGLLLLGLILPAAVLSGEASQPAVPLGASGQPELPTVAGSAQATPEPLDTEAALQQARELLKNAKYDDAIKLLKEALEQQQPQTEQLRATYLLLIKAFVQRANDYKFTERETEQLYRKEARAWTEKCLRTKELRHTAPDPTSLDYPPEMVDLFARVRAEIFGSFRIVSLAPSEATVLLDADTLSALPGETALGGVDIDVGRHMVIARTAGYKDLTEEITISPNSTLERSYELDRKHGKLWYASWGTAGVAVVGGVVALAASGGSDEPAPEPLPGPPPPPTH